MSRASMFGWAAALMVLGAGPFPSALRAADDGLPPSKLPSYPLEGVWIGESILAHGRQAPPKEASGLRLVFQGDELRVREREEGRERACSWIVDEKASPARLDFTIKPGEEGPQSEKTIAAIFKRRGDELTLAFRKPHDDRGRPTEFESKLDSGVTLVVLKKQVEGPPPRP